jgi:hypothetical protein
MRRAACDWRVTKASELAIVSKKRNKTGILMLVVTLGLKVDLLRWIVSRWFGSDLQLKGDDHGGSSSSVTKDNFLHCCCDGRILCWLRRRIAHPMPTNTCRKCTSSYVCTFRLRPSFLRTKRDSQSWMKAFSFLFQNNFSQIQNLFQISKSSP